MKFLDMNNFVKNRTPVTSTEILTKNNEFNENGLFSESIFGALGSNERRKSFSYINLECDVVHPAAYKLLLRLDKRVEKIFSTESEFQIDENGKITIVDENGYTGIKSFKEQFDQISFRGGSQTREDYIKTIRDSHKKGELFINFLPIIPPDFRPAYQDENGQWIVDDLNDIYIKILRKSFQVKSSGSGPLYDLLNFEMQKSMNEHDNYIRGKLGKKHGAIRNMALGKRADFTGRGVITPGAELQGNEVGVPFKMAVKLFEPFILNVLLKSDKIDREEFSNELENFLGIETSVDSVQRLLKSIKNGDEIPKKLSDIVWNATEIAIQNRTVICKRDPVLHTESLRGFYPKLVEGNTIQIPTIQVGGFNADFDGDSVIGGVLIKSDDFFHIDKNKLLKYNLADLKQSDLFEKFETKEKDNGIVIDKYKPTTDLKIQSINSESGDISYNKITEYSVHKNINLYKLSNENFETFWASSDHSLIIYDENESTIRKANPKELSDYPKGKYLIQKGE